MDDLSDLTILVTRPKPQGEVLSQLIESQGGTAIYFPTIEIVPTENQTAFKAGIASLDQQDWLIFISPQSVYNSMDALRTRWPTLPNHLKIAAVGESTAQLLKELGIQVDVFPDTNWDSESLLAMPELVSVEGKKILIIRGLGGRNTLDTVFRARGAQVTHAIAYERKCPARDTKVVTEHKIDVVICTSGDGVLNLKKQLASVWPLLFRIPLIVISERIKMLAEDLGFQTIWLAPNASHNAILKVLAQKRNELCQMKIK